MISEFYSMYMDTALAHSQAYSTARVCGTSHISQRMHHLQLNDFHATMTPYLVTIALHATSCLQVDFPTDVDLKVLSAITSYKDVA